ncbi:hypothetical protein SAMN04488565_0912 [Leucobacter chromiiresistens]|uniref:Uncharacterized protein n=2 Tax=Leucobacter chromiiresistens TaxID=1079994 RepID=A0A1H0YIZ8_9MICO|nr:hypothetical protein SAMN04488565_0912 [Leucobacter chromiiresistens]
MSSSPLVRASAYLQGMSDHPTPAVPAIVQCTFCLCPNIITADDLEALCKNCGLDLSRLGVSSAAPAPPETDGTVFSQGPDDTLNGAQAIATLFADETSPDKAASVVDAPPIETTATATAEAAANPKPTPMSTSTRRSPIHPWVITGAFAVLIVGAIITTWVLLSTPPSVASADAAPKQATPITLEGWNATPAWTFDATAEETAESADGATLLVTTRDDASIVDTTTGDLLATQELGGDTSARAYWAGDTALVVDGDTLRLWSAGQGSGSDVSGDTESDQAGWATTKLGDATVSLRGDAIFAVAEVGAKYERIHADASRDAVTVPTEGAVPVAASGDTITWGTNKGVAYVTARDGSDSRDTVLAAPTDAASVSRWISGDTKHVYVVWSDGDTDTVAVHSLESGDAVSTHPLSADREAAATSTRDGAHVAYAGVLIDATTGAITETSHDIDGTVGERFLTTDPLTLVNPTGDATPLEGDSVTLVAMSPDGDLVVSTGDAIASLAPASADAGARTP